MNENFLTILLIYFKNRVKNDWIWVFYLTAVDKLTQMVCIITCICIIILLIFTNFTPKSKINHFGWVVLASKWLFW